MLDTEKLLAPLSGDNPCGDSAADAPEYEALDEQVKKLQSLTPEPVDWPEVKRLAATILQEKSKDLLVSVYLCWALFETDGYLGLATGLNVCGGLTEAFWDGLYPPKRRMRGRVGAVNWLGKRFEESLGKRTPSAAEAESVTQALTRLEQWNEFLVAQTEGDSPELGSALRTLRSFVKELAPTSVAPAEAAPKASAAAGSAAPAGGSVAAPLEVTSEGDIPKALKQGQTIISKVAAYLLENKPADPRGYRLRRLAAWLPVERLPPDQNGVTQIGPAHKETSQRVAALFQAGDFKAAVAAAEQAVSRMPFWLDAHWHSLAGLRAMGETYVSAGEAVEDEVGHFVVRFPNILELKFSDGSPFASDDTRLWVEQLGVGSNAAGGGGAPELGPEGVATLPAWKEATLEARRLAAKGCFGEAVGLFSAGLGQARTGREVFFWRLEQALFCQAAKRPELAAPQLERLDVDCQRFHLNEWEPDLEVQLVRAQLECQSQLTKKKRPPDPKIAERIESLFARLCSLDLEAALSIDLNRK